MGQELSTLIANKKFEKGVHEFTINRSQYNLSNGLYLIELRTPTGSSYLKINCLD